MNDYPRYVTWRMESPNARPRATYKYLTRFYSPRQGAGFKLMYTQLRTFPEIGFFFMRNDVQVVHLMRRNLLDVVISRARARATGSYHTRAGEPTTIPGRLTVDPHEIVNRIQRLGSQQKWMRRVMGWAFKSHHEVWYENLIGRTEEFTRLCEWLGADAPKQPASQIVKNKFRSLDAQLENAADVVGALEAAGYGYLVANRTAS